jgi:hypothetical protein
MVMSLHIRKAAAARTPFVPAATASAAVIGSALETVHMQDGPRHPELDSLRDLLAAEAVEHEGTAATASTTTPHTYSQPSYNPDALLVLAGFENGRVYAIQVDIQGKPPQWHLASHAACATEAILSLSFVDPGDMGLACSANSICSACHLSDVSTACTITSLSHTMMHTLPYTTHCHLQYTISTYPVAAGRVIRGI